MTVDLHLHTVFSDGLRTPEETVVEALEKKMSAIAITDHDTVAGIEEAIQAAQNTNLEVITGVELSCVYQDKEVHLLAYYFDIENDILLAKLNDIRQARINRAKKIISKLQDLNYSISFDDFTDEIANGTIGRLHIARYLVNKSLFHNTKYVFDKLLANNRPAYVEREKLDLCQMIEIVLLAGGIPVVAHPGIYDYEIDWQELANCGLIGIEAFHTKHSRKQSIYYQKIANKYELIVTGGSDCHGIASSSSLGSLNLSHEIVDSLKKIKYR